MLRNALEALQHQPVVSPSAAQHLQHALRRLERQMQPLEAELLAKVEHRYAVQMPLLCPIPGIERKMAALRLLFAGGFARLDTYRQLSRTVPKRAHLRHERARQSAHHQDGRRADPQQAVQCNWSARKANAACNALYEQLTAQGKSWP